MDKFIFTCGDTNGIGPEIVIKTLNKINGTAPGKFYFICPYNIFEEVSKIIKPEFTFTVASPKNIPSCNVTGEDVILLDIGDIKLSIGKATKESGKAAFKAIKLAYNLLDDKKADAMITAPISKTAIQMAGHKFPGHTEMLAEWCGSKDFVMMFLSQRMNAALITIHEPIKKVSSLITKKSVRGKIEIILNSLQKDLNIMNPKAAILGLNPHAGENGIIGKEEENIIGPVIRSSSFSGSVEGPFSPDAFFAKRLHKKYDVIIGMYHDQVLIPFKMLNFSSGVNYTAGLSIIRTSPDHGTAYDIAMQNKADESSIYEAFLYAQKIVKNRKPLLL